MSNKALVFAGFLCLSSFSAFAGAIPSEWDRYCRKCHIDRPVNSLYDPSIKAHSQVSLSCVGCHRDKGIAGHVKKSNETFVLLFQDMTLPPDVRPPKTSSVTSEECLRCHPYIREVDEISQTKLPKAVRPIKLRAAHGQHWDYRTFTSELRDKLESLSARKTKYPLAKAEQAEFDRLSQIEKMQCSRCHERFRKGQPGRDRSKCKYRDEKPDGMHGLSCRAPHRYPSGRHLSSPERRFMRALPPRETASENGFLPCRFRNQRRLPALPSGIHQGGARHNQAGSVRPWKARQC